MIVVITAGGVKERIDNVRSITNSSTGKLGMKIAQSFLNSCECAIIYIHGPNACLLEDSRVENIEIKDTEDLLNVVSHCLITKKVDIFIHSMAVADYTTEAICDWNTLSRDICTEFNNKGSLNQEDLDRLFVNNYIDNNSKVGSNIEKPLIVLKQTPKVIESIKKLSPYTFLVGFKLLDNVEETHLFDVGFNLLRKNRCNLVIANDLAKIKQGEHRGLIIYPEKTYDVVTGKDDLSAYIVKQCLKRFRVKHPKSIQEGEKNGISNEVYQMMFDIGKWLDVGSFLPLVINHDRVDKEGTYGNLSCKDNDGFFITCRNVNKGKLRVDDISKITKVVDIKDNSIYSNVYYNSELKPSIDTTIHSKLYQYSSYSHIVHIHTDRVFLGVPLVSESFPCGCDLECNAILSFVKKDSSIKVIQMFKHGLIIMGNSFEECKEIIINLFNFVPYIDYSSHVLSEECKEHLTEVSPSFITEDTMYPLCLNNERIGSIYEDIKEDGVHFGIYTSEKIRGKGLNIVKKYLSLRELDYYLHTTIDCGIAEFYKNKFLFVLVDDSDESNIILKKEM